VSSIEARAARAARRRWTILSVVAVLGVVVDAIARMQRAATRGADRRTGGAD
jgi:hypothetical protein